MDDKFRKKGKASATQRSSVACQSFPVGLVAKQVSDIGYSPMSQLDEVTRGLQASLHIVNHYGVNEFTGVLVIDKHDGDFHFRQQRYVQGANARRGNHNAIHSPLGERMHNLSFTVW